MKNSWKIGIMAVAMLLIGSIGFGATFKVDTQASAPAFIIANNWTSTVTLAIATSGSGTTVTVDGNANAWTVANYTNASEWAALVERSTNAAGQAALIVNRNASLATDSISNNLTTATYSLVAGSTTNRVYWNVPNVNHFDTYGQADYQPLILDQIFGNPGGTGTVTLSVYVNQALAWQALLAPGYVLSNDAYTSVVVTATGTVGPLPIQVGLPIEVGKKFFIRAERATDATSGSIGYVVKPQ